MWYGTVQYGITLVCGAKRNVWSCMEPFDWMRMISFARILSGYKPRYSRVQTYIYLGGANDE